MSVGKPNRSGTAANRLQTAVASRDGLAAEAKGQGRPVCLSDQIDAALTPTKLLEPYGDPRSSDRPAERNRRNRRLRPLFHETSRLRGPTSDGKRSFFFRMASIYRAPIPINNCVPSGSASWQKKS
jgi:hypothetical protein